MKRNTQPPQHIATWRASGLTQADYCRENGLNAKTFSAWVRNETRLDDSPALEVIPVQVIASEPTTIPTPLKLCFKHGMQLELSTAVSPSWLAELLQCLA